MDRRTIAHWLCVLFVGAAAPTASTSAAAPSAGDTVVATPSGEAVAVTPTGEAVAVTPAGEAVVATPAGEAVVVMPSAADVTPTEPPLAAPAAMPATLPVPMADVGAPVWSPPGGQPQHWEWLRLTSGEWLKGELHELRREQVDFESDELDELTLDWDDVAEFRSPRVRTYAFTGQRTAMGVGQVIGGEVIVLTALGEQIFPRADLLSIVQSDQREWSNWSGKASVGFTARSGNTDQLDAQLLAKLKRQTAFTRLTLDYVGNYSEAAKVKTANNQTFDARFDRFVWERLFVTPFTFEVFVDEFQNIDHRISPGAGLGYDLVDRKNVTISVGLDGVDRRTQFLSVQAGGADVRRDGAARPSLSWEIDLTSRVDFDGSYAVAIGIPDPDATNQSAQLILSVEITTIIDIDTTFTWDRVGKPEPDVNGVVPLQDDYKLSFGFGLDF